MGIKVTQIIDILEERDWSVDTNTVVAKKRIDGEMITLVGDIWEIYEEANTIENKWDEEY